MYALIGFLFFFAWLTHVFTCFAQAGLAMNACMLNSSLPYCKENAEIHVKRAYQQADAMLEERAK